MMPERARLEAALRSCDAALGERPQDAQLHKERGNALQALERYEEAIQSYDRAIALRHDYADAYYNQGTVLNRLGRHDAAIASFERAIAINPRDAEAYNNRGIALEALNRHEAAIESFDRAIQLEHGYSDAYFNAGNVLQALNRYEEAAACYDRALAMQPQFEQAWNSRGQVMHELGRYQEALACFDKALGMNSALAESWNNRGNTLQELKRYQEALAGYDRTLALMPEHAEAATNRGNALKELNRYEEALASHDRALQIKPDFVKALSNRALALQHMRRYDDAMAGFERVLALEPDSAEAHWNQALCRLLTGEFARGWEQYEWRWKASRLRIRSARRNFSEPLWLGKDDLTGKTILLHSEQGLGDTIQFSRYAASVAQIGATVILEVQPALKRLLSHMPGASEVLSEGEPLPEFDCHCPLLSLPLAFNTSLTTIPATIPYLSADSTLLSKWDRKLGPRRTTRVGIVWSGLPAHRNDHNRSIALSAIMPLADLGVTLVSLQREVRAGDEKLLASKREVLHFGSELEDFSDTAALVSLMDLVISVDTSVAHLAGALGKPVWILLPFAPDWRWLVDREDSPWYPSARLFRQPRPGDWRSVLNAVRQSLVERLRRSTPPQPQ